MRPACGPHCLIRTGPGRIASPTARRGWRRGTAARRAAVHQETRRRTPQASVGGLVDVDVAVGGGALLLGGDELRGEGVDLAVGAVDVHDPGLVALELGV